MPNTTPDNIFYSDTTTPLSLNTISSAEATSVQEALNKRQRYEFVWANAAARTAQTGMVAGSTGYQLDTKSEYVYDAGSWRLQLSYAEYLQSGTTSVLGATFTNFTGLTLNGPLSSDSTFTAVSGGNIVIAQPGIYSMSMYCTMTGPGTGAFMEFTADAARTQVLAIGGFILGGGNVAVPFYRTTVPNQTIYLWVFQNTGATQTVSAGALRIGRLG